MYSVQRRHTYEAKRTPQAEQASALGCRVSQALHTTSVTALRSMRCAFFGSGALSQVASSWQKRHGTTAPQQGATSWQRRL